MLERRIVAYAHPRLRLEDDIPAESRMFPHLRELLRGQRPRLVEDAIRNSHLTDVVQRRQTRDAGISWRSDIFLSAVTRFVSGLRFVKGTKDCPARFGRSASVAINKRCYEMEKTQ